MDKYNGGNGRWRHWISIIKAIWYRNPYCCQMEYCKKVSPEDYTNPKNCKDCKLEKEMQ